MRDFLVWYNNRDVVPFLEDLDKQFAFYQQQNIDMFKDGISVPGLTLLYLFNDLPANTFFTVFNESKTTSSVGQRSFSIGTTKRTLRRYVVERRVDRLWATTPTRCTYGP